MQLSQGTFPVSGVIGANPVFRPAVGPIFRPILRVGSDLWGTGAASSADAIISIERRSIWSVTSLPARMRLIRV
jgi:hypothetical protein